MLFQSLWSVSCSKQATHARNPNMPKYSRLYTSWGHWGLRAGEPGAAQLAGPPGAGRDIFTVRGRRRGCRGHHRRHRAGAPQPLCNLNVVYEAALAPWFPSGCHKKVKQSYPWAVRSEGKPLRSLSCSNVTGRRWYGTSHRCRRHSLEVLGQQSRAPAATVQEAPHRSLWERAGMWRLGTKIVKCPSQCGRSGALAAALVRLRRRPRARRWRRLRRSSRRAARASDAARGTPVAAAPVHHVEHSSPRQPFWTLIFCSVLYVLVACSVLACGAVAHLRKAWQARSEKHSKQPHSNENVCLVRRPSGGSAAMHAMHLMPVEESAWNVQGMCAVPNVSASKPWSTSAWQGVKTWMVDKQHCSQPTAHPNHCIA